MPFGTVEGSHKTDSPMIGWILLIGLSEVVLVVAWILIDRNLWGDKTSRPKAPMSSGSRQDLADRNVVRSDRGYSNKKNKVRKMKRKRNGVYLLAVLAISLSATVPAMAQHQQHHQTTERDSSHSRMEGMQHGDMQGTMTGGMMQGQMENMQRMMSSKLHRTLMMAYVLPTMGDALSMSADQVSRLAELKQSFAKDERIAGAKLASAQKSLGENVTSIGDADKVRATMRTRASLSADLQVLTYNSALRMLSVLSAEQRDHVENMKPMQLHHHMMSSMTNDEMSEVMQGTVLGSIDCPMMSGNMMMGEMGSKVHGSGSD